MLTEACFLLPHRAQRARLARLLVSLDLQPYESRDEGRLRVEVFEWLAKYADHEPDWADGYLAVISGRETRWRVWTYDGEFRNVWRRANGSRIPLAVRAASE